MNKVEEIVKDNKCNLNLAPINYKGPPIGYGSYFHFIYEYAFLIIDYLKQNDYLNSPDICLPMQFHPDNKGFFKLDKKYYDWLAKLLSPIKLEKGFKKKYRIELEGFRSSGWDNLEEIIGNVKPFILEKLNMKEVTDPKHVTLIERGETGITDRVINNHHYLKEKLAELSESLDLKFINIQLGKLSIENQMRIFSNTKLVVAQHGAGLSNIVWATPELTIIEIVHLHRDGWRVPEVDVIFRTCFEKISEILGQKHVFVFPDEDVLEKAEILLKEDYSKLEEWKEHAYKRMRETRPNIDYL